MNQTHTHTHTQQILEPEAEKAATKKYHLIRVAIYGAWFFLGILPVALISILSSLLSPNIALIIWIVGTLSVPVSIVLAIYHLIKWISV